MAANIHEVEISGNDPAFKAGYEFVDQNVKSADGFNGFVPFWHGWALRSAFWAGVSWMRHEASKEVERCQNSPK
jgi:hypothetical protein